MPSEYAKSLGARLRSIRQQQGLSLQGVEEKSNGRWKAVVVGSYERGDRAVTVSRLAELADFYRVPSPSCCPTAAASATSRPTRSCSTWRGCTTHGAEDLAYVARYARAIQQQRGDYNGRVLSIRADDLRALAIVYDSSPSGPDRAAQRARRPGRRPAGVLRVLIHAREPGAPGAGPRPVRP